MEPEDLELNSTVFLWPQELLHVFELSDEVILPMWSQDRGCYFEDGLILIAM